MGLFSISYDSEYGEIYYEGVENQSYQSFISSATKAGVEGGFIEKGSSVLDHDHEITRPDQE